MGRTKARKSFTFPCSEEGLREYANFIHQYSARLTSANQLFVKRLAEAGYEVATARIVEALPTMDEDKPIGSLEIVTEDSSGQVASCRLQFTSQQALFIEFGSGITYNKGEAHPLAGQFGYGVGTFPHQKHAYDPNGWSYYGEDDTWHHSRGTKATMPMFKASEEMRQKIIDVAREVYQGVI